jgi:ribonuclease VapC
MLHLYGKGRHKARLSLGDSFAYALVSQRDEPLLFQGNVFAQTDVKKALEA